MSELDGLKVCVDEMNRNLKFQYEGIDSLKATARSILSAASLVTGLMGILQLVRPAIQADFVGLYNFGIVAAVLMYIGLIVASVRSITAITMFAPVAADWMVVQTTFANKSGADLLNMQISALQQAIRANEPIIKHQRDLVLTACVLLPAIVVVLFAMSLIPRV